MTSGTPEGWAHLIVNLFVNASIIILIIIQIIAILYHWCKYKIVKETVFVLICIFIILITNSLNCTFGFMMMYAYPSCNICGFCSLGTELSYITGRLGTYLFYLIRAKLAQSFDPIIRPSCFTKYLPMFFIFIYVLFIMALTMFESDNGGCAQDTIEGEPFVQKSCMLSPAKHGLYIRLGLIVEFIVVIFFTYLFIQPLMLLILYFNPNQPLHNKSNFEYNNYDDNNTIHNSGNNRSESEAGTVTKSMFKMLRDDDGYSQQSTGTFSIKRRKLQILLLSNVLLSFLSLICSSFTMILWPTNPTKLWVIPYIDYFVNSYSTFFMLGRNRKWIWNTGLCILCRCIWIRNKNPYMNNNGNSCCRCCVDSKIKKQSVIYESILENTGNDTLRAKIVDNQALFNKLQNDRTNIKDGNDSDDSVSSIKGYNLDGGSIPFDSIDSTKH